MAAKRVESLRAPCLDAGSTPASSTGRGSPTSLRFTIPPLTEWLRRGRFPIFGIRRTAFLSAPVAPALQPKEGAPRVGEALAARSLFRCEFRQAAAAAAAPSCRLPRIRRTSEFPPVPAGRFRLRVRCGRTPSRNPLSPFLRCRDACRPPDLRHLPDVMGGASGIPRSPFPRRETRGCCCGCARRPVSARFCPDACSTVFRSSYFSAGALRVPSVCGVVPSRSAPVRTPVPQSFAGLTSPSVRTASRPSAAPCRLGPHAGSAEATGRR